MTSLLVLCCFSLLLAGVSGADDVTVSVKMRDSVTLSINASEINERLQWKYNNSDIASFNLQNKDIQAVYPNERFTNRLNVDPQTGSLTINNIRTEDTGEYQLEIKTSNMPDYKLFRTFSVTVTDQEITVSVMKGGCLSLPTGVKIQPYEVKWMFNGADLRAMRFENMNVIPQTGELYIRNIRPQQSGTYDVQINSRYLILHRIFRVNVSDQEITVSVMKGGCFSLSIGVKIQPYEVKWMFNGADLTAMRFENMNVIPQTGELYIGNIRPQQSGTYDVQINIRNSILHRIFRVNVSADEGKSVSVTKGENVTLKIDNETLADDVIKWTFEETLIAEMDKKINHHTDHVLDKRFGGRLDVKPHGSLIITQIESNESGLYDVRIINSKRIIHKRFSLTVNASSLSHQLKIGPGLFVLVIMLVTVLV